MAILLLKFPILVVAEVLKSMTYREVFLVSLASTRTQKVVKASMFHARCAVSISFGADCTLHLGRFHIKAEQGPRIHDFATYKIGSLSYKVAIQPNMIVLFWTQPSAKVDCAKDLFTHISEVFNRPTVYYFELKDRGSGETELEIIKHSRTVFQTVEKLNYANSRISPEVFVQVFHELRNLKFVCIATNLPDDFDCSPTTPDYFQIDELIFRWKIHWVKLDDYMECKDIELKCSPTRYHTPAVLQAFIKKWIDAVCRLETLVVRFPEGNFDFPAIVNGLGEIQQEGNQRFVEIEGANGKKARVSKRNQTFKMEVRE